MVETTTTNNNSNNNEPANTINRNNMLTNQYSNPKRQRGYVKEDRVIHHMYQLQEKEKDKVKVLFREATLRGWRLDQIPEYIWIKSKINVTYGLCKHLKERQYLGG